MAAAIRNQAPFESRYTDPDTKLMVLTGKVYITAGSPENAVTRDLFLSNLASVLAGDGPGEKLRVKAIGTVVLRDINGSIYEIKRSPAGESLHGRLLEFFPEPPSRTAEGQIDLRFQRIFWTGNPTAHGKVAGVPEAGLEKILTPDKNGIRPAPVDAYRMFALNFDDLVCSEGLSPSVLPAVLRTLVRDALNSLRTHQGE